MTHEFSQITELAKDYNLIPIVRKVMADTETPIRLFQHFAKDDCSFLLESAEGGIKWARYSFIGTDPFMKLQGKQGEFVLEVNGSREILDGKPIELLKEKMADYKSPRLKDLPPFTGGAAGFFGYDLLQYYEKLPAHRIDDLQMNDLQFMFCDQLVVFDHYKQQVLLIANVHLQPNAQAADIAKAYDQACMKLTLLEERLQAPAAAVQAASAGMTDIDLLPGDYSSNMTKEQFIEKTKKAQQYIREGDLFQVVLSQRFNMRTEIDPFLVYRVLRSMNPSPYMYYLKMDDEIIVGTSPEALVKVENGRAETRPIAGTRPRGKTEEEDLALEKELLADEKERAEHLMLVDLGRNDIGRVSEFGSVKCDSYMEVERFSHVMHIVSNVSGKLRKDKDFFDAFLSCLPAGTVSGAPKLRAMEVIAELENEARGPYAGAIGYLGFAGAMNSCITIRTIIFKQGMAYVQSGAGIVWDSVPENEYMETVNKASAMLKAIKVAEAVFARPINNAVSMAAVNSDYDVAVIEGGV